MSTQNQLERESDDIEDDLDAGEISQKEANKRMLELEREYRYAAEEAYDDEIERW